MNYPLSYFRRRLHKTSGLMTFTRPELSALRQHLDRYNVLRYIDEGKSAKDIPGRPAFRRLMRDCEDGKLDVVLAVEWDRTSRNMGDFFVLDEFFKQHGIKYIELDCEDTSIDTPDKFLKRGVKAVISHYERMHTAERVKKNIRQRAKQGKFHGGTCPYGFSGRSQELINLSFLFPLGLLIPGIGLLRVR